MKKELATGFFMIAMAASIAGLAVIATIAITAGGHR